MSKKKREVVHQEFKVRNYREDKAMTMKQAKELLGWEECEEKDAQFTDYYGKPVRCANLVKQRHMSTGWMRTIAQEVLRRRWRWTAQTISIGKTKMVIDGQNRLFGFVWAGQEWNDPARREYWKIYWKEEPRMEVLVAFGVDEDDATINAYDQVRPRSLTDVLERSPYLAGYSAADRRAAARICADAVKLLWDRTGAKEDPYAPRQTNTESMDFVCRHEDHLLQAVQHIYECNSSGRVACWINPGAAVGLLYLMGCSSSNPAAYHLSGRRDGHLDWRHWDRAKKFWSDLASESGKLGSMEPLCHILRTQGEDDGSLVGMKDRIAVFCKAWNLYVSGEKLTTELITPRREPNPKKANILCLAEDPRIGGIDTDVMAAEEPPVSVEDSAEKSEDGEDEEDPVSKRKGHVDKLLEHRKQRKEVESTEKILEDLKREYPNRLLVMVRKRGDYAIWGEDATAASKILDIPIKLVQKHYCVEIPKSKIEGAVEQLKEHNPLFVECDEKGFSIREPKLRDVEEHASVAE